MGGAYAPARARGKSMPSLLLRESQHPYCRLQVRYRLVSLVSKQYGARSVVNVTPVQTRQSLHAHGMVRLGWLGRPRPGLLRFVVVVVVVLLLLCTRVGCAGAKSKHWRRGPRLWCSLLLLLLSMLLLSLLLLLLLLRLEHLQLLLLLQHHQLIQHLLPPGALMPP